MVYYGVQRCIEHTESDYVTLREKRRGKKQVLLEEEGHFNFNWFA